MEVACGQCLGCRVDRSLVWAMRIVHESDLPENSHGSCFVTLTYRDKWECTDTQFENGHYLPSPPTLVKSHVQKFLKRLRSTFPQKIRYLYCGEYGEHTFRPHYHLCLFNVTFSDLALWKNDNDVYVYTSPTLEKLWPYGFSTVGELNFDSAAYTAGYVLKKVTGKNAEEHYTRLDPDTGELYQCLPEYINMSLKPGIGSDWYSKFSGDLLDDTCPVPGKGVIKKIPRYYQKLMEAQDPESLEQIKMRRQAFRSENPHLFEPAHLMAKYKIEKKRRSLKEKTL